LGISTGFSSPLRAVAGCVTGQGGRVLLWDLLEAGSKSLLAVRRPCRMSLGLVIAPAKDEDFVLWLWRPRMTAGGDFLMVIIKDLNLMDW